MNRTVMLSLVALSVGLIAQNAQTSQIAHAETIQQGDHQTIPRGIHKMVPGEHESISKGAKKFVATAPKIERTDKIAELIDKCSKSINSNASSLRPYVSRGLLRIASADAGNASDDALHVLNASDAKPELKTMAALILYLAHMRNHDPEKAKVVLGEADSRLNHDVWPYPIVSYLRRETEEATLLKETDKVREMQSHAFLAYDHLFKNENSQAKKEFDWLERNVYDQDDPYHQIAFAELKRLDPSHTFRLPDYDTYMTSLQNKIKKMWTPPKGSETRRVVAIFKVHKNGLASNIQLTETSGTPVADAAAIAAVERAAPFQHLPEGSPDSVDVQFTFDYNVWKDGQLVKNQGGESGEWKKAEAATAEEDAPSPTSAPHSHRSSSPTPRMSSSPAPAPIAASGTKKSLPSGYNTYANARYGFSIAYPALLLKPKDESENSDGRIFVSSDNQAELRSYGCHAIKADGSSQSMFEEYNDALGEYSPQNNAVVTFKKLGANWFVISGVRNNRVFYRKTLGKHGDFVTFIIEYPVNLKSTYDPVTENVASFFVTNPYSQF